MKSSERYTKSRESPFKMGRPRGNRRREHYYRTAKKQGYRSRSAFKLKQIIRKHKLLRGVDRVVELCSSPGGWTQVLREEGEHLEIVAVDISSMSPLPRVSFIKGDITDSKTIDEVKQRIGGTADLVLSDCSPNVTGIWEVDVTRQLDLAERTIDLAMEILTKNGKALTKVFQGPGFKEFLESVKDRFELVRLVKPDASRKTSAEIYMLAMHPKGVKE